ncbi:hypothetical protein EV368DRAFT_90453 [Lentinula lateritia]|nr:hypothetical protein EV368DRAFT_90453 [Lentinula lateritia]
MSSEGFPSSSRFTQATGKFPGKFPEFWEAHPSLNTFWCSICSKNGGADDFIDVRSIRQHETSIRHDAAIQRSKKTRTSETSQTPLESSTSTLPVHGVLSSIIADLHTPRPTQTENPRTEAISVDTTSLLPDIDLYTFDEAWQDELPTQQLPPEFVDSLDEYINGLDSSIPDSDGEDAECSDKAESDTDHEDCHKVSETE